MSECLTNLKNFLGDELISKLGDVLKDATDSSPMGLSQKALEQAQKLADTKAVVQQGIMNFKNRMGLPGGRLDGLGGLNLGEIKQKADALKTKAQEVQSKIADFQSQFPGCALDPDIMQTISTVASIDSNLDPLSMIDTSKLDGEIADAQSKIDEATYMQAQSVRLQNLFGVPL